MLNEGNQIHNFMSSSGSGSVINYGSGSDFLTSYSSGSGSGSKSQKVTVPTVPVPVPVPQHCLLHKTILSKTQVFEKFKLKKTSEPTHGRSSFYLNTGRTVPKWVRYGRRTGSGSCLETEKTWVFPSENELDLCPTKI